MPSQTSLPEGSAVDPAQTNEARQAKEARIYRLVIGTWCLALIAFGMLNLMDVIDIRS
jgi:hypothetical protein